MDIGTWTISASMKSSDGNFVVELSERSSPYSIFETMHGVISAAAALHKDKLVRIVIVASQGKASDHVLQDLRNM